MMKNMRKFRLIVLLMFPLWIINAQEITFVDHMDRSDISLPVRGATGTEVAMEGDYAVVGIPAGGTSSSSFSGLALVYKYDASSDTWSEIKTLTPSLPRNETYFGWHVEIYGDLIAVSEQTINSFNSPAPGAVYIFQKDLGGTDNWGELAIIEAPANVNNTFGWGIALTDSTLIVSPKNFSDIFIYERDLGGDDNWGLSTSFNPNAIFITPHLRLDGDRLFYTVASEGTFVRERNEGGNENWGLVKFIPHTTSNGIGEGIASSGDVVLLSTGNSVRVHKKDEGGVDNWGLVQSITGNFGFGRDIDLHEDLVIVADPFATIDGLTNAGRTVLFSFDPGASQPLQQIDVLTASVPAEEDFYGSTVAVEEDRVLVGATQYNFNPFIKDITGRALFHSRNAGGADNWGEVLEINDTANGKDDLFAAVMSAHNDLLLVSAHNSDANGNNSGCAYLYGRNQGGNNNWGEIKKFTSPNPGANKEFSRRNSLYENAAAIGEQGQVHIFYKDEGGTDNWGIVKTIDQGNLVVDIHDDILAVASGDGKKVFIYQKDEGGADNWGQVLEVTQPNTPFREVNELKIEGDDLYIGDAGPFDFGGPGRVLHYSKDQGGVDNWGLVDVIQPTDSALSPNFGNDLAIYESLLVVTSSNSTSEGSNKLFLFDDEQSGFVEKKVIDAEKIGGFIAFGRSVALSENYMVTADFRDQAPDRLDGVAYVYGRDKGGLDNWGLISEVLPPIGNDALGFGLEVEMDDESFFIHASFGNSHGIKSGSVYHYEIKRKPFITQWDVFEDLSITIPTSSQPYRFDYKWINQNDPTIQISGTHFSLEDGDFTTTFPEEGFYTLEIEGHFPHLIAYPEAQLIDVIQWGDNEFYSMKESFKNWQESSFSATDTPDLTNVTDMTSIFEGAADFEGDLSMWVTDSIEIMTKAFADCYIFNSDISTWNVSNVTAMDSMFAIAESFDQDISHWDVSNVTTMASMFKRTEDFDQPIGVWNVQANSNFDNMFEGAKAFNQNLGAWRFDESDSVVDVFLDAEGFECEAWSQTIIGWHVNNQNINNIAISGPQADYDETASDARDLLVARGWTVNGNATAGTCINKLGKYWTGAVDTDWDNSQNWFPEVIPVEEDSVIIVEQVNNPILSSVGATLTSMSIQRNGIMTVDPAGELYIDGDDVEGDGNFGILMNDGAEFINHGFTEILGSFVGILMDLVFINPAFIHNHHVLTNTGFSTAMRATGLGGSLTNEQCAILNITTIGNIKGRITNLGLINYISDEYEHEGEFVGESFRFDQSRVLPTDNNANDNPTYLDFFYDENNFNMDRDGDGVTLCEGDIDDLFKTFNTRWQLDANVALVISPAEDATYDFQYRFVELANSANVISGSFMGDANDFVFPVSSIGEYELQIFGDFSRLLNYDKQLLNDVSQWGDVVWSNMQDMFIDWPGNGFTAQDAPDLSQVLTMRRMFSNAQNFSNDLSNWDLSNVQSIRGIFNTALNFNGNISSWDVSNVTDMKNAFANARDFNGDVSGWNVSNVTDMNSMFFNCTDFDQDISSWDVSNVTDMNSMFRNADSFDQPIGTWDINSVTDFGRMFEGTASFDQYIGDWSFDQSTNLTFIVHQATGFGCDAWTQTVIGWNYRNQNVTNKNLGQSGTLDFDGFGRLSHDEMEARGWSVPGFSDGFICADLNKVFWIGEEDIQWDNGNNWYLGIVPAEGQDVYIPPQPNQPTLDVSTPFIKSLEIFDGAVLTINANGNLNLED